MSRLLFAIEAQCGAGGAMERDLERPERRKRRRQTREPIKLLKMFAILVDLELAWGSKRAGRKFYFVHKPGCGARLHHSFLIIFY